MKKLAVAAALVVLAGALVGARWERFVMSASEPAVPFAVRSAPPAPDHGDLAARTALP